MKRVALYVWVSTASKSRKGDTVAFDQDPTVQEAPLREMVAQRRWEVYEAYSDRMSGSKERRPGLDRLMADAKRGKFDVVVVWRFDRFARSVRQLVNALEEFRGWELILSRTRKRWIPQRQWGRSCSPSSPQWRNWSDP